MIPLIVLLFSGCGKTTPENEENMAIKQGIIAALNANESDLALRLATDGETHHPNDLEYTYYKAQAYSQKATIDIYTLFPIIQMKIFDVAIQEWESANAFEKKRKESLKISILGDEEADEESVPELEIQSKIDQLKSMDQEVIELSFTVDYSETYHDSYSEKNSCSIIYSISSPIIPFEKKMNGNFLLFEIDEDEVCSDYTNARIEKELPFKKKQVHSYAKSLYSDKLKQKEKRRINERFLKSAIALFDSIPIFKRIPRIEEDKFPPLYQSLAILKDLYRRAPKGSRLKKNAFQQLGLLSGYLIAYTIKDSIELEEVKNPSELACKANAKKVIQNYKHLLAGVQTMLDVIIDTKFYKKNKASIEKALEYMKLAPEFLSEELKEKYIDTIVDFQEDNC